jgi:hypothetical protein
MRKLKQLCSATVLTLIFSFTAFAGDMQTPPFIPPPLEPMSATGSLTASGVTASGTSSDDAIAMDSVTDIALFLLDSMMTSVF